MISTNNSNLTKNTSYKVVVPFYGFAAISFFIATLLLFLAPQALIQHYFHPQTLAITHLMALGWGTMMILGASHQLVPVLIEEKLFSNLLAYLSFLLAALGIPLLIFGFYTFNIGSIAQCGAILVNAAVVFYIINLTISIAKSNKENVHAVFIFTAALWLLLTTSLGLLLVYNFTSDILPRNSLYYLSLHAHMGIVGWFLLLVIGTGSRLIPLFLISKYNNTSILWLIYVLINIGLVSFILIFLYSTEASYYLLPTVAILTAILFFGYYCYRAYSERIRKRLDNQMKISLLSILLMSMPIIILAGVIASLLLSGRNTKLIVLYGFFVFFGWITAIILGMTFKTLPFIIWNKVYLIKAGLGKAPNPKDLFSNTLFTGTGISYLFGLISFATGILVVNLFLLRLGAAFLVCTAVMYNLNIFKLLLHKSKTE